MFLHVIKSTSRRRLDASPTGLTKILSEARKLPTPENGRDWPLMPVTVRDGCFFYLRYSSLPIQALSFELRDQK